MIKYISAVPSAKDLQPDSSKNLHKNTSSFKYSQV